MSMPASAPWRSSVVISAAGSPGLNRKPCHSSHSAPGGTSSCCLRLDALRDHAHPQAVGERDDAADDGRVDAGAGDRLHERPVQLDGVDRVRVQVADVAVPGAEVVDGAPDAQRLQGEQRAGDVPSSSSREALGQLELEQARGRPDSASAAAHQCRHVLQLELAGGEVHRDGQVVEARPTPVLRLPAGREEDPGAQRSDQPRLLGSVHERAWRDQAVRRVLPPDERLDTHHGTGDGVELRLVVQGSSCLSIASRIRVSTTSCCCALVCMPRVHLGVVPAGGLRLVHRRVRVAAAACRHPRRGRGACAMPMLNVMTSDRSADPDRVGKLGQHPPARPRHRFLGARRPRAAPRTRRRPAARPCHSRERSRATGRHPAQHLVPDVVAVRVVHVLEAVQVDEHHGQRPRRDRRVRAPAPSRSWKRPGWPGPSAASWLEANSSRWRSVIIRDRCATTSRDTSAGPTATSSTQLPRSP